MNYSSNHNYDVLISKLWIIAVIIIMNYEL